MGHVLLTTVGTAGDVVPFLHLGRGLKVRGHRVTLASHGYYEEQSRRMGIDFVALDTLAQFDDFIRDGNLLNRNTDIPKFLRRHILPQALSHCQLIERSCTPETVIVSRSAPAIAAHLVAEKHRLPYLSVLMTPSHITTLKFIEALLSTFGVEMNDIRSSFGLAPVKQWVSWWRAVEHYLGLWPDWFNPGACELSAPMTLTGFLWHDDGDIGDGDIGDDDISDVTIADEIAAFLAEKPAPILITGGTGVFGGDEFFRVSLEACQHLNRPVVLVARLPEILPAVLPENARWFSHVPSLMALAKRSAVVIHHGGMGILSQALTAGVPHVILAAGGDRPDNAILAQKLGVGEFLSRPRWQTKKILQALLRVSASEAVAQCCREIANRLQGARPVQAACASIEAVMEAHRLGKNVHAGVLSVAGNEKAPAQGSPKVEDIRQSLKQLTPQQQAFLMSHLRRSKSSGATEM